MQISFAFYKGQPEMILHPAEPTYIQLFERIRADRFRFLDNPTPESEYLIAGIPVPAPHIIEQNKKNFARNAEGL